MKCANCGSEFEPNKYASKQKYCPECSPLMHKKYLREYSKKRREQNKEEIYLQRKRKRWQAVTS